jgi:hypothetical protein
VAEQRIDGTGFNNAPKLLFGGSVHATDDRADGESLLTTSGVTVYNQVWVMRAWSASLAIYVTWTATILDSTAAQYTGLGAPLTDIVQLRTR